MNKNNNSFGRRLAEMEQTLTSYALSLTSNLDDAKDLVQESYYKALSNSDKFNMETNLQAWMYTILKNTFINNYRRNNRRNSMFPQDIHEYVINNRQSSCNPESDFSCREMEEKISALAPEFRIPFMMHNNGYKYQEIAEELNLKLGTVKSRIHFSKEKIKERLEY